MEKKDLVKVHQSQPFAASKKRLEAFTISASKICNGDYQTPLYIKLVNVNTRKVHSTTLYSVGDTTTDWLMRGTSSVKAKLN